MPRRRPRLPTLPKQGEWEPFSAEQVVQLEQAYGHDLPEVVLLKMQLATALYTAAAPAKNAISNDDFFQTLAEVQEAGKRVREVLPPGLGLKASYKMTSAKTGQDRLFEIIKQYFGLEQFRHSFDRTSIFDLLTHALIAADAVCEFAVKELADYGYTHPSLWNLWIRWLTVIAKEHSLPYSARSDSYKTNEQPISPFVRLVEALQKCIPPEARHSTRDFALAKAISRARRGVNVDCKFSDIIDLDIFPGAEKELVRLEKNAEKGKQTVAVKSGLSHRRLR